MISSRQPNAEVVQNYNKFVPVLNKMIQDATKVLRSPSHNRVVIELYVAQRINKNRFIPHIVIHCQSDARKTQIERAIQCEASKKVLKKYNFPIEVVVFSPFTNVEFRAFFSSDLNLNWQLENMATLRGSKVRTTLDMLGKSIYGAEILI